MALQIFKRGNEAISATEIRHNPEIRSAEPARVVGLTPRLASEALGSTLLLAIVVGSGIMAERLSGGNAVLVLLSNSIATAAGLAALILALGSISGAHFNPAVTLSHWLRREIHGTAALLYIVAQGIGATFGAILAHAMFEEPLIELSTHARSGVGQLVGEFVATFGLVLTVLGCRRSQPQATAYAVGLFIMAGYWFTSSTSFANPGVTIARVLTDSFTGIRPVDAPAFIAAQLAGASAAAFLSGWLWRSTVPGRTRELP